MIMSVGYDDTEWGVLLGVEVLPYDDREDAEAHARAWGGIVVSRRVTCTPWSAAACDTITKAAQ